MKQIDLYRQNHRIIPIKERDDYDNFIEWHCRHDGLKVNPERDGGFRHDLAAIRRADLMGTVMPDGWDVIRDASELVIDLDERRRLLDADVEEANRWTEDELVTIANQSGMDVRRA